MFGRLLARLRGDENDGESDQGTVWDLTPSWQYGFTGRFHGGGDARAEQEDVIEDVTQQAERLEDIEHK